MGVGVGRNHRSVQRIGHTRSVCFGDSELHFSRLDFHLGHLAILLVTLDQGQFGSVTLFVVATSTTVISAVFVHELQHDRVCLGGSTGQFDP